MESARIVLFGMNSMPHTGGPARYLSAVRRELVARGDVVEVAVFEGPPDETTVRLPKTRIAQWVTERSLLKRFRPHAAHVHGHWTFLVPVLWEKLFHPSLRAIFTFHTATELRGLRRSLFRSLLNRCDAVTAVSADLLARESAHYRLTTPLAVTYPGADLPAADADAGLSFRRSWSVPPTSALLVAVAPLQYQEKVEGVLDLIRAVPKVRSRGSDVHLVLVGDGRLRPRVEATVSELRLGETVHLVGSMEDPSPALQAADVVCHVSYRDELPLAVLEGMAHGKPIVCLPIGGLPEVLRSGDEAVFVDGTTDGIADAVAGLLDESERMGRLGRAARRAAADNFTWSETTRKLLPLYGLPTRKAVHVTIDVEEDYLLRGPGYQGVEEALPALLEILRTQRIPASLFFTAECASRYPDHVERARMDGHHIGVHGISHAAGPLAGRRADEQARDVSKAVEALGSTVSSPCAFRAPNFRVDAGTVRAFAETGIEVDSSVVPGRVVRRTRGSPRIDFRGAPHHPYRLGPGDPTEIGSSDVIEVPVTPNPEAPGSPIGMGLLNLSGVDATLVAVSIAPCESVTFLIHPWEMIDYPKDAKLPRWMQRGCSSDRTSTVTLFRRLSEEHSFVPFGSLLNRPYGRNAAAEPIRRRHRTGPNARERKRERQDLEVVARVES